MGFEIDYNRCNKIINFLKKKRFNFYDYKDEFPNVKKNKYNQILFHIILETLDYDLYNYNRTKIEEVTGKLEGKVYTGADLLSIKFKNVYETNPDFFTIENLRRLKLKQFKNLLKDDNGKPILPSSEFNKRFRLIKDISKEISEEKIKEIIQGSQSYLIKKDGKGFLQAIKKIKVYNNSHSEKANLLAKALELRKLINFKDDKNKKIILDEEVINIILRLGILISKGFKNQNIGYFYTTKKEKIQIKKQADKAVGFIVKKLKKNPYLIDDILWHNARSCYDYTPLCNKCLFQDVCSYNEIFVHKNEKILIINTGKCNWGRCIFCGIGKLKFKKMNSERLRGYIKEFFTKIRNDDRVAIYNSGSFFDENQILKQNRLFIYKFCKTKRISQLVIESRPEFISSKVLLEAKKYKIPLKIALGLETANDRSLKKLNKGFTLADIKKACNLIKRYGFKIRIYILVNAPYTNDENLTKTVKFAKKYADDVYFLNCVVHKRTALQGLRKKGLWKPLKVEEFKEKTNKYQEIKFYTESNNKVFEDEAYFLC